MSLRKTNTLHIISYRSNNEQDPKPELEIFHVCHAYLELFSSIKGNDLVGIMKY